MSRCYCWFKVKNVVLGIYDEEFRKNRLNRRKLVLDGKFFGILEGLNV